MPSDQEVPLFDIRNQAQHAHWSDDYLVPTPNPTAGNKDLFVFNLARRPYQLQMYGIKKLSGNYGGNKAIGLGISQPMSVIINFASEHLRHPEENEWQHLGRAAVRTGVDYVAGNFIPLYKTITFSAEVANYYWEKYGGSQELYKFENVVFDERFQNEVTKHLGNGLSSEAQKGLALVYGNDLFEARREALQQWQFWANIHKVRSAVIETVGNFFVGKPKDKVPAADPVVGEAKPIADEISPMSEWNYEPFVGDADSKQADGAASSAPKLEADFSHDNHHLPQQASEPSSSWEKASFYAKPIPGGIQFGVEKTHVDFGGVSIGVNIDANALGFISNVVKQIFGKRKIKDNFEVCGEKYNYELKKISGLFNPGEVRLTLLHEGSGAKHERWFKLDWNVGELCFAPDNLNSEPNKSLIEENLNNALSIDLGGRIPGKINAFNGKFNELLGKDEYRKAKVLCDEFFARYKDISRIMNEEGGFRLAIARGKNQYDAVELFDAARAKIDEGDLSIAITKFKAAQELFPDNSDITINLADAYVKNEEFELGIDQAKRAVELDSGYAGNLQEFQKQYRDHLLSDPNMAVKQLDAIKRCYENSVDADESERWLKALHGVYMFSSDMDASVNLLKGWLDTNPDHQEADNVRLVLAKVQCLDDDPSAAEATFSQLKGGLDPMNAALYFGLHQDAQTRVQYTEELGRDPTEMLKEMYKLPDSEELVKHAHCSADLDEVPKVDLHYRQKMFEAEPDSFPKFMLYVIALFDEGAASEQMSAAFKKFRGQELDGLDDNEMLFYHQLLRKANFDGLLDEDIAANTYKTLATEAVEAIEAELLQPAVGLKAVNARAGVEEWSLDSQVLKKINNNARVGESVVANNYKALALRFTQAMTDLKAAVEEGNAKKQSLQLGRANSYLISMLDATDPETKVKFLSNAQLAEWASELESVLDNEKCFLAKGDGGPNEENLIELKQFYKTSVGVVKIEAGMRIAKFRMDGVETLQFILPFVSKAAGISRYWQFHMDSVLEAMSRHFQMQATVPGLPSGYAELQKAYLLIAGGLRIYRNCVSAEAEGVGSDRPRDRLYNSQFINRLSFCILAADIGYFYVVNKGAISGLQKLSFGYQIFSLFNGFFEQWEYERALNQDISDPTLLGSTWAYDVLRAVSGGVSRSPYLMGAMYGAMTYNSVLFLVHAAAVKMGEMAGKLSSEFVLKEGVEQFAESLVMKFTAEAAGKAGAEAAGKAGAEGGLKILPALAKAVNYALIASLVYDVASLLGFNWESRQLQKIAKLIKEVEYEEAEIALKEFDDQYWYSFHRARGWVAEQVYHNLFGSEKGYEVYRLNKIYVLREFLWVSLQLNKKNPSSRGVMLNEALERVLGFAKNAEIFNEKLPDYNDTLNSFDDAQASLYRLFITSHYDVHQQDGFALNIRLIAMSAFMMLRTGKCDLTNTCSDALDKLLNELSKLDLTNEKERDEYLLRLDIVHEFLLNAAARDFWERSACRIYGLSTRCEKDFQQYQAKRDAFPVEDDEVANRLNNLDKETLAYRLDRAFEAFRSRRCDLSTDCEGRLNHLDAILLKHDAMIKKHGLESELGKLRAQASAHQAYGAMHSMQEVPCDLSDETIKRTSMFSQRIENAKIDPDDHYQLDSDIRRNVDRVSARCYTQTDVAYGKLESAGGCKTDSSACDAGLKNLHKTLSSLPWNDKSFPDRYNIRVQGYAMSRLSQAYGVLETAFEKDGGDLLPQFSAMRDVLGYTNEMLVSSAYAGMGKKYLRAGQELVLAKGLQTFRAVNVHLAYSGDKEYQAYKILHRAVGSVCMPSDKFSSVFFQKTTDSEQQRHERNLHCFDEMARIHRGRLPSLKNTFTCAQSRLFLGKERLDFFNTMADLVIRGILLGVPLMSAIFSQVACLKRFAVNTQSVGYKRFDSLLAVAREVILYGAMYKFVSAYPSMSMSASCQGLSQCVSTNFIEQLGLIRLLSLLLNRGMDEGIHARFGFSKNYFLIPLLLLSTMISAYYFSMVGQSFFMTYIVASQLGNVFDRGLRYMKHNHVDVRVGRLGWFAKNFVDTQQNFVFRGFGLNYFAYSILSMLPAYSKALKFYGPIANFCLPPVSFVGGAVDFFKNLPLLGSLLSYSVGAIASIASFAVTCLSYASYAFLFASLAYVVKTAFDQAAGAPKQYGQLDLKSEGIEQNKAFYLPADQASQRITDTFHLPEQQHAAVSHVENSTLEQRSRVDGAEGFSADSFMNQAGRPPMREADPVNLLGAVMTLFSRVPLRDLSLDAAAKVTAHPT